MLDKAEYHILDCQEAVAVYGFALLAPLVQLFG